MAITSPILEIPMSRRYSLLRSRSMSLWMRFSVNVSAYVADTSDGIPAAVKKFTHIPVPICNENLCKQMRLLFMLWFKNEVESLME